MSNDPLLQGAVKAYKNERLRKSSGKTRYNHLLESTRFVKALRALGYGVKRWKNVTNRHVDAVVTYWIDIGLEPGTIKTYLSGVRFAARFFGNDRISAENSAFRVPNRVYVTQNDKSLPQENFEHAVAQLKLGLQPYDRRIAAMLLLERHLGLRTEEAAKFNPQQAEQADGRIHISHGTKGGRERMLETVTPAGREAIEYTRMVIKGFRNLIPKEAGMTERNWQNIYYRRIRQVGISRKDSGASGHGNRHAYAQERYQSLTRFPSPCKFPGVKEFLTHASEIAGSDWIAMDKSARQILKAEMGHGPDRDDVVNQYLGSIAL